MRLDAFDITRRAREAYGPDVPKVAGWPISPFETEALRVRLVEDPAVPEPSHGTIRRRSARPASPPTTSSCGPASAGG